jgi:hypothetical protein
MKGIGGGGIEGAVNRMLMLGGGFLGAGIFMSQFVFVVDGGERRLIMDSFRGL